MGFTDRFRLAWQTFRHRETTPTPVQGEVALADPNNIPGGDLWNQDTLISRKGMRIIDKMRRDEQVRAAMSLRKMSVLSTGWTVKSPDGKDKPDKRWEVTEFIDFVLREFMEQTLEHQVLSILTAKEYGFSISEKIWRPIEAGPFSGKIGIADLKTRAPHDFVFQVDKAGNLTGIKQESGGTDSLPIEKFVIFVNDKEFGNWYGKSELGYIYRSWNYKNHAMKYLGILLERYGVPPMFALYNPTSIPPGEKNNVKNILKNLQTGTSAIIPRKGKDDFELITPEVAQRGAQVFIDAISTYDNQISKGLLLPGLVGLTTDSATGSFARSKVHFDVFLLILESDRTMLAIDVMDRQVIRPLVDVNFGPQDEYPFFEWLPLTDSLRTDILEVWQKLVDGGSVQPQVSDEEHIRSLIEFPEKEQQDGQPELPGPELRKPPAETPDANNPPIGDGVEMPDVSMAQAPPGLLKAVNFKRIERRLDSIDAQFVERGKTALERAKAEALAFVERKGDKLTPKQIADFSLRGRGDFKAVVAELLRTSFDIGRDELRSELTPKLPAKKFQEPKPNFAPRAALTFLNQKAITITASTYDPLLKDVRRVLQQKLQFGLSVEETKAKLSKVFEPHLGNPAVVRDTKVIAPHRLEAIARTESTAAFNQGRLVEARDPDVADFVQGMLYSATIDSRTTAVCEHLNGRIFKSGDPNLDRLAPPNHVNCRSLLVAVTIGEKVKDRDFLTPTQAGRGIELAGKGFV